MHSILSRKMLFFLLLLIFICTYLSFGQIQNLNFYKDDFSVLYSAQKGIMLPYPFHLNNIIFVPLYNIFKLNPQPYYLVGLILFCLTSFLTAFLSFLLFPKKIIPFITSTIFIFSFVGSEAMYYINQAILINLFLILELTTLIYYFLYLRNNRLFSYLLSLFFFFINANIMPVRTHATTFLIIALHLFEKKRLVIKELTYKVIPFLFIDIFVFVILPLIPQLQSVRNFTMTKIISRFSLERYLDYSSTFLNMFIPNTIYSPYDSIGQFFNTPHPSAIIFPFLIIIFVFMKKKKIFMLLLWILIIWASYSFIMPVGRIPTLDRYFFVIRPFFAILVAGIIYYVFWQQKKQLIKFIIPIISFPILVLQATEHFKFQKAEINEHGIMAKQKLNYILDNVPSLNGYSIFYFVGDEPYLTEELNEVFRVGFLPHSSSLAFYYNTDYNKIKIAGFSCKNLLDAYKEFSSHKVSLYYFRNTYDGVIKENSEKAKKQCGITDN